MSIGSITSKARPWPYDAIIGGVPVRLAPGQDGNLVSQKTKTLDATAPVDYSYSSANPFKERAYEWQDLFGGFGQSEAPVSVPRRYDHGAFVDTSIDGLWMLGPRFEDHIETVAAGAGEVRKFVKALHGGVLTVFAICQNGIWRRTSDGVWTASLTTATAPALPGGVFPQDAIRFKHRGASPVDALYVGTNNTNLYKYDGAAWTVAGAAAGPGTGAVQGEARYFERVGDELWVAGDYWIVKVEDDPMDRTKYAAVIYIGDQSCKITQLRQVDNTLYIWKEDGVYSISTAGVDQDLFPTLRGKNSSSNGKNAAVWIDKIWFTFGDQTFTLDAGGDLTPDGLEQMLENTSDVRGQWVAGAGHNTWFFYEFYYNIQLDTTYLVKHGTWVEEGTSASNLGAQFADAHHGALYEWGKKVTCAEIISGLHTGGNDRLYVGFLDGTLAWTPLPRNGPNPAEDGNCEFTGNTGAYVYLPIHHSGFRADNKLYHGITAMGPTLTTTEWVEVDYKLDINNELASWSTLNSADDPKFTLPGQRLPFTQTEVETPVYGKMIQLRVHLRKNADTGMSPKSTTPIIHGIAIHEAIRPSFSREYTLTTRVASFLPLRNGNVDRRRGVDIYNDLLAVAAEVGPVVVTLPWGVSEEMVITDYHDTSITEETRRDYEWGVELTGVQLATVSHEQVFSGLTYDVLEQYTLDELESII